MSINNTADKTKRRFSKVITWLTAVLVLILAYLVYVHRWQTSEQVKSNHFKLSTILSGHHSDIWSVDFSPDGKWIASGSVDSTVKIWKTESGVKLFNLKQRSGITYLAFSPDSHHIATASYDSKVRIWNISQGIVTREFTGHVGTVWSVDYSSNGKTLASSGEDAAVRLWDVTSGQLIHTFEGHTRNVWSVSFSPDGNQIASSSFDNTIKIWDVRNEQLLKTIEGHTAAIISVAFSHNGKLLASTSDDKTIRLWSTMDWQLINTFNVPEHIQAVDFSPDDKLMITGGRDKPAIGELLQNFFGTAASNKGVSMRLWDVTTGKLLQTFSEHANDVNDVKFSPDGKWIVSGSSDRTVGIWRLSE